MIIENAQLFIRFLPVFNFFFVKNKHLILWLMLFVINIFMSNKNIEFYIKTVIFDECLPINIHQKKTNNEYGQFHVFACSTDCHNNGW
ncbi:hypothetical protein CBP27_20620 [Fischerella thermalis WC542]|nr:hypothetical protein CBP17_02390 [Fischerella thermalis WC114]PLZ20118.1 hypothetical protein CBP19_00460 [Fischerella thermalis WC1110]PLZ24144.1 hypothetical protein CBP30_02180 [Fischerella thermalis WC157]PLZ24883.1 hypothetical protein CBP28_16960 [Fischerella thermalis WC559]PLZ31659.1 hypothetical protein CBP27_20620 [Fischerella thermalis WC542]PLZ33459.1 hypothetical protein CBP10_07665 [Fischerella thermalis WC558]PLZ49063.1 hypothetical protein CBP25_01635 [Fischerella thermalis